MIHTTPHPPNPLPNEALTKYSIRVQPTLGETLHPDSRVNYGKTYAVEHNVKVLDIGMVVEQHRHLLTAYFDTALRGPTRMSNSEERAPRSWMSDSSTDYSIDRAPKSPSATKGTSVYLESQIETPKSQALSTDEGAISTSGMSTMISRFEGERVASKTVEPSIERKSSSAAGDESYSRRDSLSSSTSHSENNMARSFADVLALDEQSTIMGAGDVLFDTDTASEMSDVEEDFADANDIQLNQLLLEVDMNFDDAIALDKGWAWNMDNVIARKLFNLSCRFNNFRASIHWLATRSMALPHNRPAADAIENFLELLSRERPFLSYLLDSYLSEIVQGLKSLERSDAREPQTEQYALENL